MENVKIIAKLLHYKNYSKILFSIT